MADNGQYNINQHWKIVNSGGQQVSNTPEQLWELAVKYFKWCDENPITAKRTLTSGKTQGEQVNLEFKRPYSIKAFCLHANISERYIVDIKESHEKDSEWYMVVEKILYIIYTDNLEGAVVDLYNPIMVSKILNLDKGTDGDADRPVKVEIVSAQAPTIPNSENQVIENLDFEKVEILKGKLENSDNENSER
jgi:hypothetical protein